MAEFVGVAASALAYAGAVPGSSILPLLLVAFAGAQAARAAVAFRLALAALTLLHEVRLPSGYLLLTYLLLTAGSQRSGPTSPVGLQSEFLRCSRVKTQAAAWTRRPGSRC